MHIAGKHVRKTYEPKLVEATAIIEAAENGDVAKGIIVHFINEVLSIIMEV